jgi:hypothetical protein
MNGRIESSLYHSLLRISVCVCALVVLFDSGLLTKNTALLSNTAQNYVASAVGVKVSIAPNDVNILTARITELEREVATKDREIAVNLSTSSGEGGVDRSTFVLSIILFILLVLIVLNYALDYMRSKTERFSYKRPLSRTS